MRLGDFSSTFTQQVLTRSSTAARMGLDNTPPEELLENGIRLSLYLDLIQHLIDDKMPGKKIRVSSGYRAPAVNAAVGGSKTSDHMKFCAADIEVDGVTPYELACFFRDNLTGYQQLIHEFGEWVHVAIPETGKEPAGKLTTAQMKVVNGRRQAVYTVGISPI